MNTSCRSAIGIPRYKCIQVALQLWEYHTKMYTSCTPGIGIPHRNAYQMPPSFRKPRKSAYKLPPSYRNTLLKCTQVGPWLQEYHVEMHTSCPPVMGIPRTHTYKFPRETPSRQGGTRSKVPSHTFGAWVTFFKFEMSILRKGTSRHPECTLEHQGDTQESPGTVGIQRKMHTSWSQRWEYHVKKYTSYLPAIGIPYKNAYKLSPQLQNTA